MYVYSISWLSKNPFHSIYFAVQTGAAELSTGLLGFVAIEDKPPISMLITHVQAEHVKKANSLTTYTSVYGVKIRKIVTVASTGRDDFGDIFSTFKFTWSFKLKPSRPDYLWHII